jgi:hypothetical protein
LEQFFGVRIEAYEALKKNKSQAAIDILANFLLTEAHGKLDFIFESISFVCKY